MQTGQGPSWSFSFVIRARNTLKMPRCPPRGWILETRPIDGRTGLFGVCGRRTGAGYRPSNPTTPGDTHPRQLGTICHRIKGGPRSSECDGSA